MLEALESAKVGDRSTTPDHTTVFQHGSHMRFVGDKGCGVIKLYTMRMSRHLHASHQQSQHAVGLGYNDIHMVCKCELRVQNDTKVTHSHASLKLMTVQRVHSEMR